MTDPAIEAARDIAGGSLDAMRRAIVDHLLTAPRRPTTTGMIQRFHRTLRQEFLTGRVFDASPDRAGRARSVGHEL